MLLTTYVKSTRHKVQEFLSLSWELSLPWLDFYMELRFSYLLVAFIFIYSKARGVWFYQFLHLLHKYIWRPSLCAG